MSGITIYSYDDSDATVKVEMSWWIVTIIEMNDEGVAAPSGATTCVHL